MLKKLTPTLLTFILLMGTQAQAMHSLEESKQPLKRSKLENGVITQTSYKDALDKAVHTKDALGMTALHGAAYNGDYQMCSDLLSRGASAREQDTFGNTPLHYAVEKNYIQITELIINSVPTRAKKERMLALLCLLRRIGVVKDVYSHILSHLPELTIAYPRLCAKLIKENRLSADQLAASVCQEQIALLTLANKEKRTAHDIAKGMGNTLMRRTTNIEKRPAICIEEVEDLLAGLNCNELKEN